MTRSRSSTDAGSLTLPVELGDLPDGVVWLPTNARGCAVRATLRAVQRDDRHAAAEVTA